MASTNLIKAAVQTGYIEELYTITQYAKLNSSIDTISQDLTLQVFKDQETLYLAEWKQLAHKPEVAWVLNFETIRDKVHQRANVVKYHVNKKKAKNKF